MSNNTIAKNTLFLYLRMIFAVGVGLYSSRILLNALGVVDLGIYNLIAGIVTMLSFLNLSLGAASSRFITFALGKEDRELVRRYYSALKFLHICLAIIIFLLVQIVGIYMIYKVLEIPAERLSAAFIVLQTSTLAIIASVLWIPDTSLFMAYEKMDIYAYISIAEAILKLCIVYLLPYLPYDKLISYACLYLVVQLIIYILYVILSKKNFISVRGRPHYDADVNREVYSYLVWVTGGSLAYIGYTQGLNIILNLFFGPIANAARGIATQVQAAITNVTQSFQSAVRPRIIKGYADGDYTDVRSLVYLSSKYGYYLTLLIVAPLFLSLDKVLKLWLIEIPPYTVGMARLFLIIELIGVMKAPLLSAIHATGRMRKFQTYESGTLLLVLPVSFILLKLELLSPEGVIAVLLVIESIAQIIRVAIVAPEIKMSIKEYIKSLFPIICVSGIIAVCICFIQPYTLDGFWGIVLTSIVMIVVVLFVILLIGITAYERKYLYLLIWDRLNKK